MFKDLKTKDEDYLKKLKEKDQKRIYNEMLSEQLKEKKLLCLKENQIENNLIKRHLDCMRNLDKEEKIKREQKIKKVHEEKDKMLSIHRGKTCII